MARKNEYVVLIVGEKPRAMCKKSDEAEYVHVFEATEVVNGTFKRGTPTGMKHHSIYGIFTATTEKQFIIYTDWSANRIEDCNENGFPKSTSQLLQDPPEEREPGDEATMQEIRSDVESKIGQTVSTGWGPSLVVGIVQDEKGREMVHLKEFGEEDYTVDLRDWYETINL